MEQHESGIHPMNNRKQGGPPCNLTAINMFIYRRPTLYPLEIAVDFLKSL